MRQFKGFTPQQQFQLLTKMGYSGPDDLDSMNKFVESTPAAASKLLDYMKKAQNLVQGSVPQMAEGGLINSGTKEKEDSTSGTASVNVKRDSDTTTNTTVPTTTTNVTNKLTQQAINQPKSLITKTGVATIQAKPNQLIKQRVGKVQGDLSVQPATVTGVAQAQAPKEFEAAKVEADLASDDINTALQNVQAVQGVASKEATVKGQLESLMADFEGGATPPWASGAMREAMGIMQARGLGASSMAGQAVVQAAMESAIGIASQDAATQAQFEMRNLDREQETLIFKTQQRITGILSDQAQVNAAAQFNAKSDNDVKMFFAGLQESVSRFNAEMINATRQFNAGEINDARQFNANMKNLRQQFNANNSLVIAQANAQWRQNIATVNTAARNEAMLQDARNATGLTMAGLDEYWQTNRDLLAMAFTASESALDRDLQILLGEKALSASEKEGWGQIAGMLTGKLIDNWDSIF